MRATKGFYKRTHKAETAEVVPGVSRCNVTGRVSLYLRDSEAERTLVLDMTSDEARNLSRMVGDGTRRIADQCRAVLYEIAELLDGLGETYSPQTIESDYLTRARYLADVACGRIEPMAGVSVPHFE